MKKSSCVVRNCESSGSEDPELTFFNFPKDDSVRKKWLEALSMYNEQLNKRSKVCSKHFKKLDYDVKTFNYTIGGKQSPDPDKKICEWKSLKPEAVPSQNLPQKSTFKIKISKKDNNKEIKVEEVKIKEEKVKPQTKMPKKQPVEVLPRPRTQSRRAASKEALKQMQLLLDDEDDAVEIPDDDVVPVEPSPPPPPKKKYKLSHRKSSDGNDRDVIVLKSITNRNAENTLELDCWVEQLEEVQKNRIKKMQDEEKELQEKLDSLIKLNNAKVIHKSDLTTAIEITEYVQNAITAAQTPPQPIILNNNISGAPQSYQLVMDPRLGLIVGAVNPTGNTSPSTTAPTKVYQGKVQVAQNLQQTRSQTVTPTRTQNVQQTRSASIVQTRTQSVPQTRTQTIPQTRTQTIPQTRTQTIPQTRTQNVQQTRTPSPVPQTGRGMRTRRSAARSSSPLPTTPPAPAAVQPTRLSLPTRAAAAPSRAAAAAQMKAAAQQKTASPTTAALSKPVQAQQKPAATPQRVAVTASKAAATPPKAVVAPPKSAAPQPKAVPASKVAPPSKTPVGKKVAVLTPVPPPPPTRSTRQLRTNDVKLRMKN